MAPGLDEFDVLLEVVLSLVRVTIDLNVKKSERMQMQKVKDTIKLFR